MSAQDGIINKRGLLQPLANGALAATQRKIAAPSRKAIAAAVRHGAIVGAAASGLRLLAAERVPIPASFRTSVSKGPGPAAASEQALIRQLVPDAVGVTGKDPFDVALRVLAGSGNYKAAQQLLNSRAKSMREFFDGWAESMRRNAQLDKEAAIRSHKKARAERTISRVRRKFNAYLTKAGATSDQLIPAAQGEATPVGGVRSGPLGKNSRVERRAAAAQVSDSFEVASPPWVDEPSHTRALEKPDADIGVHTGPKKRGSQAYLR